ncbi:MULTISPECIES: DUF4358 domain-containing protein [Lachnospiraceae]|jgi:hypothetical protein|uniref:DUF4358 domain-containing protein n=1 Tax=Faecalicatena acetigenes TaxID=2981790 RepID=A0ABT2T850_9FIRM|nr:MULTISPECIES: DUF4358 domain-containing protein [Lachnospiraceae]MCU6746443.1 DUF4358 domain-containing protein [Faecalicatena acetigenes]RGT72625.1 DUF4358 domain-containing protein [Ruminococcus sp. AF18-22]SCH18450.1 Uncharacterised protein [uncultured Clostridium sp.]
MSKNRPGIYEIMKYVVLAVIIIYIVLLMLYTSGSNQPFEKVAAEVERSLDTSNLVQMDGQALKRYYGLNSADYEGVLFYSSESAMSAEEVLIVKVKEDKQVQEVSAAIDEYIETKKNEFEGYVPEEVKLLEDAQRGVRGKYVFMAVAPKAQKYKEVFDKSL